MYFIIVIRVIRMHFTGREIYPDLIMIESVIHLFCLIFYRSPLHINELPLLVIMLLLQLCSVDLRSLTRVRSVCRLWRDLALNMRRKPRCKFSDLKCADIERIFRYAARGSIYDFLNIKTVFGTQFPVCVCMKPVNHAHMYISI